ncbi:MAG: hypothetical protein GVY18_15230 [Bacteroidetes bacterium]|jgi:hypothetical protein|nr:hypothetical protein [Bacteroidota bacterium]
MRRLVLLFALLWGLAPAAPAQQLSTTFETVFDSFLRSGFRLSPGAHGDHYLPAANEASAQLTPALNGLIASNVSSFPLSSTVAGVRFDFSTGQPVRVRESLGPIFAESAETLGDNKLVVGFNATYLSLDELRGMPLEDMRFTFLHEDVGGPGLGDNVNESDVVDIFLDLDANASIFALYATYGVGSSFDVGLAIPFVSVDLGGTARAEVNSFTLGALGQANHHFGSDPTQPDLVKDTTYAASATGIGDLALRFKFRLPTSALQTATLLDVRVPTGDENDFLGTGAVSARLALITSRRYGAFTPHLNVAYDYRGADRDSDEIEVTAGFDQKVFGSLTFALALLGEFDLQTDERIALLPGSTTITDQVRDTDGTVVATSTRTISRSNVPDWEHDHAVSASLGFRYAPTDQFQLLANTLLPINDGGLRSNIAPTVGFSVIF